MSRSSSNPLDWTFSVGHRKGKKMLLVDDEKGCWIWQGHVHGGYGVMTYNANTYPNIEVGRRKNGSSKQGRGWRAIMPHQFFYVLKYGNPPEDTQLAHTCHRRSCCNPDHVRPLSHCDNNAEKYLHPSLLDRDIINAIEDDLRDDQPIHQVAFNHCVPIYTVIQILNQLKLGQGDLFWLVEEEVPF